MSKSKKIQVGDVFPTNEGGSVVVVEYVNARNVLVKHDDEHGHVARVVAGNLRRGEVRNPYKPSAYGVGYVGAGLHRSRDGGKKTQAYEAWRSMLQRCYDPEWHTRQPTYTGCSVDPEWHNFQVFAEWFNRQYRGEGYQLDKDLIVRGNKVYSPDTSVFVPGDINKLLNACAATRGDLPIGVARNRNGRRYRAQIHICGSQQHVGTYDTPEDAFVAYRAAKEAYIKERAEFYKPDLDPRVYAALMAYTVNDDD